MAVTNVMSFHINTENAIVDNGPEELLLHWI